MAFALADIDALIEAISNDPLLRERVVKALLHEDFLALPGIVARLGERVDRLAEHIDALTGRMDALTGRMDALTEHIDALTGRMDALTERMDEQTRRLDDLVRVVTKLVGQVGNLEGWRFESKYVDHLATHLFRRYRNVRPIVLGNLTVLGQAVDDGRINDQEWEDIGLLDAAAHGRPKGGGEEIVIVMELSKTVDVNDVERVARRADIIRRAGLVVDACVDGEQIEPLAQGRLADLGVISFVSRIAQAS